MNRQETLDLIQLMETKASSSTTKAARHAWIDAAKLLRDAFNKSEADHYAALQRVFARIGSTDRIPRFT